MRELVEQEVTASARHAPVWFKLGKNPVPGVSIIGGIVDDECLLAGDCDAHIRRELELGDPVKPSQLDLELAVSNIGWFNNVAWVLGGDINRLRGVRQGSNELAAEGCRATIVGGKYPPFGGRV